MDIVKKKILFFDDEEEDFKQMTELFNEERLFSLYDFTAIHCGIDTERKEEPNVRQYQRDFILSEVTKRKKDTDILMLDMLLLGSKPPIKESILSLDIANSLKKDKNNKLKIVFLTGYTSRKELLTENELWDDHDYLLRGKPDLRLPLSRVLEGACPRAQDGKCNKLNIGDCTKKECFIRYMEMLFEGVITND